MKTIDLARKALALKQFDQACTAYSLYIKQEGEKAPNDIFEAACFLLYSKKNIALANDALVHQFRDNHNKSEILEAMNENNYMPFVNKYLAMYQKNIRCLKKYRYLFKKDFIAFDNLKYHFFQFDNEGLMLFDWCNNEFGEYVNINEKIIDRNFFTNSEEPIFAKDVYSQYQLEYLEDNVRKSEWVAKENHIYVNYTNWELFSSYLQIIDFSKILKNEKLVFLIEDEKDLYPIDFKEKYNIDYTKYKPRAIKANEITKLILHEQLSTHNGGDFFNEILDDHPNLIVTPSIFLDDIIKSIDEVKKTNRNVSNKDIFIDIIFSQYNTYSHLDHTARIVPALVFQPHYLNIKYEFEFIDEKTLLFEDYANVELGKVKFLEDFKYVKTFAPIRRITSSHAATIRFMLDRDKQKGKSFFYNELLNRILNHGYLYSKIGFKGLDNRLVRFEDGKLNPKATLSALAKFLDIPYTASMEYCSLVGQINPESMKGNVIGFDVSSVYKEYKEYAGDAERYLIEYFAQSAYEKYGYDKIYCHDPVIDDNKIIEKVNACDTYKNLILNYYNEQNQDPQKTTKYDGEAIYQGFVEDNIDILSKLNKITTYVNKNGDKVDLIPLIEPDESLLVNPLYH